MAIEIDEPPISVVFPAYNRASLMGNTIEGVLSQTRSFKEIRVVDDDSTDNTVEVLERFNDRSASFDPNARVAIEPA